jgi:hypothetical protein
LLSRTRAYIQVYTRTHIYDTHTYIRGIKEKKEKGGERERGKDVERVRE